MASSIKENGYIPIMTSKGVSSLSKRIGGICIGIRHCYDKPSGYTPTARDSVDEGYGRGSEILNADGELFKCIDDQSGKGRWLNLRSGEVVGYDPNAEPEPDPEPETSEAPEEPKIETVATDDSNQGMTVTIDEDEEADEVESDDEPVESKEVDPDNIVGGDEGQTRPVPDDIPFGSWITKAGFETLEDLIAAAQSETLSDYPYISESRAEKLVEYLTENGHL